FNRYLYFMDGGRTDELLAVFGDDVSMQATNYPPGTGGTLEFEGRAALAELYRPLTAGAFRHNSTNVSIAVADDARSASLTAYFVTALPDVIQGGVYEGTLRPTTDDPAGVWDGLKTVLAEQPRTRIVVSDDRYLHAEATSRVFGFIDDLEFLLRPEDRLIAVRSAARVGYADFGVNADRIETIRVALTAKGLVSP
ncbi:MAG: DUF1499 domain-containing protein, partial [Rhizobiales bacterium]|nr:DUF1499 domain-containing protein [Hyphomicrobiales bacterium]